MHVEKSQPTDKQKPMLTYSEMTKKIKDVVIIQPKTQQDFQKSLEMLKSQINPEDMDVGIQRVRRTKTGGILVGCNNKDDAEKLKNEVTSKLGDSFNIRKSGIRNPKIKILDLGEKLTEDELKKCVVRQNQILNNISVWNLLVSKKMKKKHFAIVETDPVTFARILELKTLTVKWDTCRVFEYVSVLRCYDCGGFNHVATNCNAKIVCLKCGEEDDETSKCGKDRECCVNCIKENEVNPSTEIDVNHSRFDSSCPVYKKQVMLAKKNIDYKK